MPGAVVVRPLFSEKLRVPSLHVIGDRDLIKKVAALCLHNIGFSRGIMFFLWRMRRDHILLLALRLSVVLYGNMSDCVALLQWSHRLAETFESPVVITHPRGHVVPRLEGDSLATLRGFLEARLHESAL